MSDRSRTVTRDLKVVAEGDYGNLTIYSATSDIEQRPYSSFLVKFTLKPGPSLVNKVPPHWHETHTEYLRVSSGKAYVVVDGVKSIIDSNSGEICVPVGVVHEWGVADDHNDEELVMWERTEPNDGEKEVFFRNMISSLIDSSIGNPFLSANASRRPSIRDIFQLIVIVRTLDNYPVIWNGFGRRFLTYSLLNIGNFIGKVFFGLKPFYMEYTPQQLWDKHKQKLD